MTERIKDGLAFESFELCKNPVYAVRREILPGFSSVRNVHDFPQIWYCYRGHYFHQVGDRVYECSEGSVVILPIGAEQKFWTDTGMELMRLDVRYDILNIADPKAYKNVGINLFLPCFFEDLGLSFSPHKVLSEHSRLIWEQVFSSFAVLNYAPADSATKEQFLSKLEEIFSVPEFAVANSCLKKATRILQSWVCPIMRIVAYLNIHYSEKITNEMLLQEGNMSRAVMYRHFKRVIGRTYAQYLQHLRVRRAHLCLRDTTYSLPDIAELCGFYDSYHMSRVYSKCVGETLSVQRARLERCREERNNKI